MALYAIPHRKTATLDQDLCVLENVLVFPLPSTLNYNDHDSRRRRKSVRGNGKSSFAGKRWPLAQGCSFLLPRTSSPLSSKTTARSVSSDPCQHVSSLKQQTARGNNNYNHDPQKTKWNKLTQKNKSATRVDWTCFPEMLCARPADRKKWLD